MEVLPLEEVTPELIDSVKVCTVKGPWNRSRKKRKRCITCRDWCVVPRSYPDFDTFECDPCKGLPVGTPAVPVRLRPEKDYRPDDFFCGDIEEG